MVILLATTVILLMDSQAFCMNVMNQSKIEPILFYAGKRMLKWKVITRIHLVEQKFILAARNHAPQRQDQLLKVLIYWLDLIYFAAAQL